MELELFPGGEIVQAGLHDLKQGVVSEESLAVLAFAPRLRFLGIDVPELADVALPVEHRLYELIENRLLRGAHGAYNAIFARMASFCNAYRRHP